MQSFGMNHHIPQEKFITFYMNMLSPSSGYNFFSYMVFASQFFGLLFGTEGTAGTFLQKRR
jgi:hypothetical protein